MLRALPPSEAGLKATGNTLKKVGQLFLAFGNTESGKP